MKNFIASSPDSKVKSSVDLAKIISSLKVQGRRVVHCHGVFDLIHPGHIRHLEAAKRQGDLLVVTVTPDGYVNKGPGRPIFNQRLRAESLSALQCVDYVAINEWPTAEETLRLLRPNYFVKGQEFQGLEDKTGKLQREVEVVQEVGAEIRFTHGIVFSSTKLIEQYIKPKA